MIAQEVVLRNNGKIDPYKQQQTQRSVNNMCTECLACTAYQLHYSDVIMTMMASQITSISIAYSTVFSGADKKKTPKLRATGLCEGYSLVTREFSAQRASNVEKVSIWWRHDDLVQNCGNPIANISTQTLPQSCIKAPI